MPKKAALSSSLIAAKGKAQAAPDAPERTAEFRSAAPLNFRVDIEFQRRFKIRAAESGLKLNELLRQALDAWEEKQGLNR